MKNQIENKKVVFKTIKLKSFRKKFTTSDSKIIQIEMIIRYDNLFCWFIISIQNRLN